MARPPLARADVIDRLLALAEEMRSRGATGLFVYGSVARDDARASSDIDLFIDYDPASRFNAFDLIGIQHFLHERLPFTIDITTRDGLHPTLRPDIEASAVRIF